MVKLEMRADEGWPLQSGRVWGLRGVVNNLYSPQVGNIGVWNSLTLLNSQACLKIMPACVTLQLFPLRPWNLQI